jgi:hypothetical protein
MKIIAHRGLLDGPNKALENNPGSILHCLNLGFECEIDLWKVGDILYLGHDNPTYRVALEFLYNPGLWIHAKNIEALRFLADHPTLMYFWHQNDDYTLTSNGYIWTYPNCPTTDKSVAVLPEWNNPTLDNLPENIYAICTDFCHIVAEKLKNNK